MKRTTVFAPILAALVAVTLLGGSGAATHRDHALAAPAAQATPPPGGYFEAFGLETDHPAPYGASARLDVVTHSRDRSTWTTLEPMEAEHGPMCEAPPASHHLDGRYEDAVFGCRDHLMTAIKAGGYGEIMLTPGHQVDFSGGEAVIRFDVSTFRASTRDWIDVWVTPFSDNLVAPIDRSFPDLQGEPRRAVNFLLGSANNWATTVYRDTNPTPITGNWWTGYQTFLVPSASRRDTVEIRLSTTHVKISMPAYNFTWIDNVIDPPLDWNKGVVQFGHHSYNPEKDCALASGCKAGTWHWDNISLSPSVPFMMIHANERAVLETSQGAPMAFTFPQPAPQGAYLRASVNGHGVQVSVDDGATWTTLTRQVSQRNEPGGGVFEPYFHPVPAGTQRVLIRNTLFGWWGTGAVNYAAIWAETVQQPPTPTVFPPTPTPFPTETPTPVPPTNTPVPPTATPVPPTNTPVPLTTVRINAGGPAYTDQAGNVWAADSGFSSSSTTGTAGSVDVIGTADDDLYVLRRFAPSFTYAIPVANGEYDVTLKFYENSQNGAGTRVFDVSAEGVVKLDDVDIFAAAGWRTAYDRTFRVTVADGQLDLSFVASAGSATVSSIQVVPVVPPTPTPTNTATPTPTNTPTPLPTNTPTATPTPSKQCRDHIRDEREWAGADWGAWLPVYGSIPCP